MIEKLIKHNYLIKVLGVPATYQEKGVMIVNTLKDVCLDVDVLILPMGGIDSEYCVSSKLSGQKWLFEKQFIDNHMILFSGIYNQNFTYLGIPESRVCLLMHNEDFAIYNSVPTAEGAIELAMHHSDITIHNSLCITFGYGRCGKSIAKLLAQMGARSLVVVRKAKDIAAAYRDQLHAIYYHELPQYMTHADFVFNTVPVRVVTRSVLANAKQNCIIIDIASAPGGTDFVAAKELGLKAFLALSLPGKVAPKTSGIIMADAIMQQLNNRRC